MNEIKLYEHQLEILDLAEREPCVGLLWEMGTGKTAGLINILRRKYTKRRKVIKTLILAPIVTLYNWKEEFQKFSKIPPGLINVLEGTGIKRSKQLYKCVLDHEDKLTNECIIIANWEALVNEEVFQILMEWGPEIVVGDELHLIKSYRSKRAKKAVTIADKARSLGGNVYGLTGTAILNSIEDIYMQYRFLDGGRNFGKNFFTFRSTYMYDQNSGWSGRAGYFPNYQPRPETFEDLNNKIYSISTRIRKEECLKELPPLVKIVRDVELSAEQKKLYTQMKKEFVAFIKGKLEDGESRAAVATLAITKMLRLMQITTGFVTDENNEIYEIKKNPRLDCVKDLLQELTPDHKIILWCCFKHNYKQLSRVCDQLEIDHVFLTGEQSGREKRDAVRRFREEDSCKVIIANRRAGGIGINLVEAAYSIVYSRNHSLGEELQSEARNHRGGSEIHERITRIDIRARGTIDFQLHGALESKQKLSDIIIDLAKE